jgi:hypothetical protein
VNGGVVEGAGDGDGPTGSAGRISGVFEARAERVFPAAECAGDGDGVFFFFFFLGIAPLVGDFFGVDFAFAVLIGVSVVLSSGVFVGLAVGVAIVEGFFFFLILGVGDGVGVTGDFKEWAGVSSSVSCARRQMEPVATAQRIETANQSRNAATLAQGNRGRLAINR